jgi:hypothetical protein
LTAGPCPLTARLGRTPSRRMSRTPGWAMPARPRLTSHRSQSRIAARMMFPQVELANLTVMPWADGDLTAEIHGRRGRQPGSHSRTGCHAGPRGGAVYAFRSGECGSDRHQSLPADNSPPSVQAAWRSTVSPPQSRGGPQMQAVLNAAASRPAGPSTSSAASGGLSYVALASRTASHPPGRAARTFGVRSVVGRGLSVPKRLTGPLRASLGLRGRRHDAATATAPSPAVRATDKAEEPIMPEATRPATTRRVATRPATARLPTAGVHGRRLPLAPARTTTTARSTAASCEPPTLAQQWLRLNR